MRRLRLGELTTNGSVLDGVLPGYRVEEGGVVVHAPGERSHPQGRHVHATPEAFLILAGRGSAEIDGVATGIGAGDVVIVEPGEDHHLVSAPDQQLTVVWLHLEPAAAE